MDDELLLPDGSRHQAGLDQSEIFGRLPSYNLYGVLLECVVVAVRFPNDPRNKTGHIEYDCDPLSSGIGRILNAVKLETYSGLDDGDENILRVAERTASGGPWVANADGQSRWSADGDIAIVTFLNGSKDKPVIMGVKPNKNARMVSKGNPGRQRMFQHRGTKLTVDDEGNTTLELGANSDASNPSTSLKTFTIKAGDLLITVDNTTTPPQYKLSIDGGNPICVFSKNEIDFGASPNEHFVLGETLLQKLSSVMLELENLSTELSTHVHSGGTIAGNTGAPNDALVLSNYSTAFGNFATDFQQPVPTNTMLSEWMKMKKSAP